MIKTAIWLSWRVDYALAEEILERIGQISMSDSSIWRQVEKWGEHIAAENARASRQSTAVADTWESVRRLKEPAGRMGVAMDGGMINIREEGWKELKVGCIFDIETRPEPDVYTEEIVDTGHAIDMSYVTHLGGPEQFGRGLWREAERRGWEHARETEALGDGAAWIWNQVQDHFYTSHQVVDWYHGADHLAVAARSLHGEGTDAAKRWLKRNRLALYQGHAARIAQELAFAATENGIHADALKREAGYFHHHQRRMNYLEMRENGWLIGSGVVESGIKQFKARFAGPGMRWSRAGAERLLPICESILSHRFDHIWNAAYYSPQN